MPNEQTIGNIVSDIQVSITACVGYIDFAIHGNGKFDPDFFQQMVDDLDTNTMKLQREMKS